MPSSTGTGGAGGSGTSGVGGVSGAATGATSGAQAGSVLPLYTPLNDQNSTQIGNTTPPSQQTLVYSPDVRIIIRHFGKQYEISADLVRGQVIRRENAASTMLWTCHNKNLRYTNAYLNQPLFYRMDAVTCYMKRAGTWVQVFTGYLDSVPYLDLYPGLVNFKATCTLKRLLCSWWNPGLPESAAILSQLSTSQQTAGDGQGYTDSGLGSLLRDVLTRVGGWDPSSIHIENFPNGFLDLLQGQLAQQQQNQQQADNFRKLLEGDVSTPAPGAMASYNSGAGTPGQYGAGQAFYVSEIVAATDMLGMGPNVQETALSQGIQQAATAGEGSRDQSTQTAFQQTQTAAKTYNAAVKQSDAAIIAVAVSLTETGLRNLANPAIPESENYLNDGNGQDHDSVGLFQQRQEGWGSLSQRMNPRQSATMFLTALNKYDWKNMDPGTAGWNVQRAADPTGYAQKVDGFYSDATNLVQTARAAAANTGNSTVQTALASPLTEVAGGTSGVLSTPGSGSPDPTPGINPTIVTTQAGQRLGKPTPDSEGAINWMMTQLGKPYVYGSDGPETFDCSSFMEWGFRSIGVNIGRDTYSQAANGQRIQPAAIQRGDTLQCEGGGHTMMWCGDGTIIEAATEGIPLHRRPAYVSPAQASGIFRFCDNGGPDITAPFNPPATTGPGNPPYTGSSTSSGGAANQVGGASGSEPIAQNLFSYIFSPDQFMSKTSVMYGMATPEKDFIDTQPLIQMVQSICGAGLRNFASAPDGSFIAYYPDYFGMDGKPVTFILEDIELKNFSLNFSDDALTTHVYVNGSYNGIGQTDAEMGWLSTLGYATVENTALYQRMRLVAPGDLEDMDGEALMKRFGVRPLQVEYANVWAPALEFLLSVRIFMEKWAAQYQSAVSFTFLPDLFPGMRVQMAKHNVQVYVNEVTHTFDYEQGFNTEAVVTAPSNPLVRNLWPGSNSTIPATLPNANTINPNAPTTPSQTSVGST